jgi:hypothetical protein
MYSNIQLFELFILYSNIMYSSNLEYLRRPLILTINNLDITVRPRNHVLRTHLNTMHHIKYINKNI